MFGEVVEIYRQSKKKKDNFWTEWISRPPAAVFVWMLRGTPVTPNQVTFLSLAVFAGGAAILITWLHFIGLLVAVGVMQLSYILDCVDGQLARWKNMSSPVGALLDFLMDEIKAFLLIGSACVRLWRWSGSIVWLLVGIGGLFVAATGITLTSFMRRPEYLDATGTKPRPDFMQPKEKDAAPRSLVGRVVGAVEWVGRYIVHYPSWIVYTAAADRLDLFVWIYLGAHTLYLGRASLTVLVKLGRPQKAPPPPEPA